MRESTHRSVVINGRFLSRKITGVERYSLGTSAALCKLDPNIKMISPKIPEDVDMHISLPSIRFGCFHNIFWEQIELPLKLRALGSPLLLNLANTAPLLYRRNMVTICDLAFMRHPEWFSVPFCTLYRYMIPRLSKRAIHIFTISEFSRREIVSLLHVPENKITVAYPSYSSIFKRACYTRTTKEKYFLGVSSLDPRKNFKSLIIAFNQLSMKGYKLIIVGRKNTSFANQNLANISSTNPNIVFTGFISDKKLVELYQEAAAFVYPSFYEGFGIPPLEAMACGCPVIASKTTSLPEACGNAAYYINPYDIDSIAKAMIAVATKASLRDKLISEGYKNIKRFNWDTSAKKAYKIIKYYADENRTNT